MCCSTSSLGALKSSSAGPWSSSQLPYTWAAIIINCRCDCRPVYEYRTFRHSLTFMVHIMLPAFRQTRESARMWPPRVRLVRYGWNGKSVQWLAARLPPVWLGIAKRDHMSLNDFSLAHRRLNGIYLTRCGSGVICAESHLGALVNFAFKTSIICVVLIAFNIRGVI